MIRDLSETLEAILTQPNLPSEMAAARIVFDRPVASFNPQQTVINAFLYDIRENLELRDNEPSLARGNGQVTLSRPGPRVDCTYLITAWPFGGTEIALQEHRLIGQIFQVLSSYPVIPAAFLQGALREQSLPVPLRLSSVDSLKNPAEFWTALGTPPRASLAVTLTIQMEPRVPAARTYPVVREVTARLEQERFLIEGEVEDLERQPVEAATVRLVELEQTVTTRTDGYYHFSFVPAGTYTLRVRLPNGDERDFAVTAPPLGNGKYHLRMT